MSKNINPHQHAILLTALNLLHATLAKEGIEAIAPYSAPLEDSDIDLNLIHINELSEGINLGDFEELTPKNETEYLIRYQFLEIDTGIVEEAEYECFARSPEHALQQLYRRAVSPGEVIVSIEDHHDIYPSLFKNERGEWILTPVSTGDVYISISAGPGCVFLNLENKSLRVQTVSSGGDVVSEIHDDIDDLNG